MELEAVVHQILEPVRGTSAKGEWVRQEVIFDQPGEFSRKVCITFWGDKAQEVASFRVGEPLTLSINLESREFNGKWYTTAQAWKVARKAAADGSAPAAGSAPAQTVAAPAPAPFKEDDADDLPF